MKKIAVLIIAVSLLLGLVAGCQPAQKTEPSQSEKPVETTAPQKEGEETTSPPQEGEDFSETGHLNILWHAAGGTDGKFECVYRDYQSTIPDLLYDTLLKLDMEDNSKYVARMAESWDISADNMTYVFKLRDDLNWTDGEPVTADDFVFSLEAQLRGYGIQNERGSFVFVKGATEFFDGSSDTISGVKADGKTITIELTQPYGFFMRTLATFCVYPRHGFPDDVDYTKFSDYDYWEWPISCGPYKLEDVKYPDYCILVRNDDWYGPKPGIKTVYGLSYDATGAEAAIAAMIAGELDFVHSNDFNDINVAVNIAQKNNDYKYNVFPAPYFRFFSLNLTESQDGKRNKFMDEVDFRRAINLAIDKEAIASYFPDQGVPLSTLVNPGDEYYNSSIPLFQRDVEGSKALLDAMGYDGSTLRIAYYYADQTTADLMDLVSQNLSEVGIPCEVQLFTQDLTNAIYEMKNYDILYAGANQMSGIENYNLSRTGNVYDKYLGHIEERKQEFDPLMDEVSATSDPVRLKELSDELQVLGLEKMYAIPVLAMDKVMIWNDAKWNFDAKWLDGTDLAIYRTCDIRLETWSLNE